MKTLVVIPARLASSRLPEKPLRELAGKPLVVRVWERVRAMRIADRCVVATDDRRVADAVHDVGGEVVMTSPDCQSGTDRVAEVAKTLGDSTYDVIVNVQGDEPFVTGEAVTLAANRVRGGFDIGTVAAIADPSTLASPDVVKVVLADDGTALYFSRAPIPFLRDAADAEILSRWVLQHIGVYAYSPAALRRWSSLEPHPLEKIEGLEQLRALAAGLKIGVGIISTPPRPGIDTEEDLSAANDRWTDLTVA